MEKKLYITSIDLKKAFDSIDTSKLVKILTNKNIPHHLNRIIEACINENTMIKNENTIITKNTCQVYKILFEKSINIQIYCHKLLFADAKKIYCMH
jgi:hypothetical protein